MYDVYVDTILEEIGRCPEEIAIFKYNLTYKQVIYALVSSNNTEEASTKLGMPILSLKQIIQDRLKHSFPQKPLGSWKLFLLSIIGLIECPVCGSIYNSELKPKGSNYTCRECSNSKANKWKKDNPEYTKEYRDTYYKNNKKYFLEKHVRYKHGKELRTPSWANKEKLLKWYENCPDGYHVDHIIPLHGDNVSGLHVETNLQYLLAKDNLSKANKFDIG
jgi:hypothetical protein